MKNNHPNETIARAERLLQLEDAHAATFTGPGGGISTNLPVGPRASQVFPPATAQKLKWCW
jgi:hypothetical protein